MRQMTLLKKENLGKITFLNLCCLRLQLLKLLLRVQEVRQQLNDISHDRERFSLQEEDGLRVFQDDARLGTSSLLETSEIFGRDKEKEEIIEALLGLSTPCTSCLEVISIVSMGGMGKTTLARFVYNDVRVQSNFLLRSWAWVSKSFDGVELTKAIIESFTGTPFNINYRRFWKDRKFLLVLDDIWNEDPIIWETIKQPVLSGAKGSHIIITTRNEKVSDIIGTKLILRLDGLPPTASWKLYCRLAYRGWSSEIATPNLVEIGHKIVERTNGIPLVLRILGGLLGSDFTLEFWSYVLSTDLWDLNEGRRHIMPTLKLSYYHLPSYLKPCFEYCSSFPRGYKFEMDKLVKLWDALGFIQADDTKKLEVGNMYINDMIRRSFFQNPEYFGSMKFFTMHDLIYDLGKSLWKEDCTLVKSHGYTMVYKRGLRHANVAFIGDVLSFVPSDDGFCLHFRSLDIEFHSRHANLKEVFNRPDMLYLQSLDIKFYYRPDKVAETIGNLKHLRY